ncbi:hypothetical protein POW49_24270, partial [Escherichia coli]
LQPCLLKIYSHMVTFWGNYEGISQGVAAASEAVNLLRDKGYLMSGDLVIVTQGDVMSTVGSTNTTRILTVE